MGTSTTPSGFTVIAEVTIFFDEIASEANERLAIAQNTEMPFCVAMRIEPSLSWCNDRDHPVAASDLV